MPVIYFGVDTASLLPAMSETGADVIGLDWRVPLDVGWKAVGAGCAVQGNLDPIALFAPDDVLKQRVREVLTAAAGRPGHIFNLGHGIVPGTPVENVIRVVEWVKEFGSSMSGEPAKSAVLLLAHGTPDVLGEMAEYLEQSDRRPGAANEVVVELQHRYAQIGPGETPGVEAPPLTKWTMTQGRLLEQALDGRNEVYVGMRNWHPYIADVVAQMRRGWRDAHQGCLSCAAELANQRWALSACGVRGRGWEWKSSSSLAGRSIRAGRGFCGKTATSLGKGLR